VRAIADWLIAMQVDDFDCSIITTYPGTHYYDLAVPDPTRDGVYRYTHPKTGDHLYAHDVDYTKTADYYKGDPSDGYRSFVFTDELTSEDLVELRDAVERRVRSELGIPFNPSRAAIRYEHSMGMGLPDFVLRRSRSSQVASAETGSS
jgi:hypothetical protein